MMGVGTWVVAVVVVVMVGVQKPGNAFNFLPVHHPSFSGPTDSQFGFSVALWKDAKGVKRVVVGAPHGEQTWANNTFPLGVAYLCKPHLGRHDDDGGGGGGGGDCTIQPNLVPEYDQNTNNLLSSYNFTLRNYGIAVGQTIVTQKRNGSRMAVCAPRYPSFNRIDYVANNGRCFVLQDPSRVTSSKPPTNEAFKGSLAGYSAATREDILVMGGPKAYNGCGVVLAFLRDGTRFKYSSKIQSRIDSKKTKKIKKSCGDNLQGWAVQMGRYEGNHSNLSIATSSPKTNNYKGQISFYPVEMKDWQPALKILEGDETGALFGYALASPDLDGDGASDLVVSAPLATHDIDDADDNMYDVGRVFIYYAPLAKGGGPRPPSILTGKTSGGRFGTSVASLGDFNDDKYEDVAVGAPYGGTEGEGVVFIYNGGSDGLKPTKPLVITPSEFFPGARGFGFSLDGDLDMDDNGYPDMVIGALHSNTALLLRASPVIKLHGSIYFDPPTINIKDNLCNNTEMPGQEKLSGVCFDLVVNLTYSSVPTFAELILGYEMKLSIDKESSMKFGFSNNTDRIMLRTKMNNTIFKEENNTHSRLRVFVQRARANLNLTISATLMASVQSYMPVDLPPMLDIFTPSTFNTSSMLVCEDNTGCSTEPDLALHAFGSPVIVGKRPMTIEVNISVEVSRDPAYGITVKVDYPDHLTYQHVDAKGNTQVPECRRKTQYSHQLSCLIEEAKADEQIDFWLVFVYKIEDMEKLLEGTPFSLSVINDRETDPDLSNNEAKVVIEARTEASLYPQSFSEPEGVVVVVNQTASTDDIKAAETTAATFPVDKLGPRVDHIFSLTNRGPSPVLDAELVFQVPLYLGESMLTYFMDQPTPSPGVTCTHLNVNPLRLQPPKSPVTSKPITPTTTTNTTITTNTTTTTSSSISSLIQTTEAEQNHHREKRDLEDDPPSLKTSSYSSSTIYSSSTLPSTLQTTTDQGGNDSTTIDPLTTKPKKSRSVLDCMDPMCLVACNVTHIPAGGSVNVNFSSYLVIATLNKLDIQRVFVKTWMTSEIAQNGTNVTISTLPAKIEVSLIKEYKSDLFSVLPLWLLILTIALAILIIAIIICALCKAGFFDRKRPPADYTRQSVRQSVRQSMIQQVQFDTTT